MLPEKGNCPIGDRDVGVTQLGPDLQNKIFGKFGPWTAREFHRRGPAAAKVLPPP